MDDELFVYIVIFEHIKGRFLPGDKERYGEIRMKTALKIIKRQAKDR